VTSADPLAGTRPSSQTCYESRMRERRVISRADALAAAEAATAVLARDPRVRLVYLFGSAADPTSHTVRDVDLGVLLEPAPTPDELLRLRADLVSASGAELDLVALDAAPVVLARETAETGRCLHANPAEAETDFVVRARARYWDWKPFLDEQWRIMGERLEERRGPAS
jgi:predicted nucleotidyltransferase